MLAALFFGVRTERSWIMDGSLLRVPARMVGEARYGLHSVLGQAAQDISVITDRKGRESRGEWYREPLERFDRARALLDMLGWGDPGRPTEALVDAREHGWALLKGLEVSLIVGDEDLNEAGLIDRERAATGRSRKEGETVLRVSVLREYVTAVEEHLARLGSRGEGSE
jgi:hypothetical protein